MSRPWIALLLWAAACGGAAEKEAEFDTDVQVPTATGGTPTDTGGVTVDTSRPTGGPGTTTSGCSELCEAVRMGLVDVNCVQTTIAIPPASCDLTDPISCLECLSGFEDPVCADIQYECQEGPGSPGGP